MWCAEICVFILVTLLIHALKHSKIPEIIKCNLFSIPYLHSCLTPFHVLKCCTIGRTICRSWSAGKQHYTNTRETYVRFPCSPTGNVPILILLSHIFLFQTHCYASDSVPLRYVLLSSFFLLLFILAWLHPSISVIVILGWLHIP